MLARGVAPPLGDGDELLIVDPPADMAGFVLPERTAVVRTCLSEQPLPPGAALVELQPGGVAHIRLGEHLLDIYAQQGGALVHLPELGLLCSGELASNRLPPRLAPGSDGASELDALRLCARLVREGRVRMLIPHVGDLVEAPTAMMERLADDVAYIHALRRSVQAVHAKTAPGQMAAGQAEGAPLNGADAHLPSGRIDAASRAVHAANLHTMRLAAANRQN